MRALPTETQAAIAQQMPTATRNGGSVSMLGDVVMITSSPSRPPMLAPMMRSMSFCTVAPKLDCATTSVVSTQVEIPGQSSPSYIT